MTAYSPDQPDRQKSPKYCPSDCPLATTAWAPENAPSSMIGVAVIKAFRVLHFMGLSSGISLLRAVNKHLPHLGVRQIGGGDRGFYPGFADTSKKADSGPEGLSWQRTEILARVQT
jgi:hypothetical protein